MTALALETGFDFDLKDILPRLRVYALSLTRNADRADDLVQQSALKALTGRASYLPGTNFSGWMFRIQRNEFISGLRRARPTMNIDDVPSQSAPPRQESGLVVREFMGAFRKLPKSSRHALVLAQIEGQSYERIARDASVSVGTVKSRVSRARTTLRHLLDPQTVH